MTSIGMAIKEIRESKGISQYKLAKLSGVAQPTISAIEGNDQTRSPAVDTVQKLARALHCSVAEIMGEETNGVFLDQYEERLIFIYNQLNADGQQLLMETAESFLSRAALREKESAEQAN